jgi:hypothetical protein
MPTGTTPRKRTWDFKDEWALAKSREILLQGRRSRAASRSRSVDLSSDYTPFHEEPSHVESSRNHSEAEVEAESENEVLTELEDDTSSQIEDQDQTIMMASPPQVQSLASSASSASSSGLRYAPPAVPSVPPPVVPLKLKRPVHTRKSGLPIKGTLTEKSTNLLNGRPSRRIR